MKPAFAALLVQVDPTGQAAKVLDYVVRTSAREGAAVIGFQRGEVAVIADRTTLEILTDAFRVWSSRLAALRKGDAVDGFECSLLPLMHEREGLVGALVVAGVPSAHADVHQDVLTILAAALAAPRPVRVGGAVAPIEGPELDLDDRYEDELREKTLRLLNANEWNIARVARLMGVTRRTVYLRLQRWNVERKKVPKAYRPRDPVEES